MNAAQAVGLSRVAALIGAGVSPDRALAAAADSLPTGEASRRFGAAAEQVEAGSSPSDALSRLVSPNLRELVLRTEPDGLAQALRASVTQMANQHRYRARFSAAARYPIAAGVVATIVLFFHGIGTLWLDAALADSGFFAVYAGEVFSRSPSAPLFLCGFLIVLGCGGRGWGRLAGSVERATFFGLLAAYTRDDFPPKSAIAQAKTALRPKWSRALEDAVDPTDSAQSVARLKVAKLPTSIVMPLVFWLSNGNPLAITQAFAAEERRLEERAGTVVNVSRVLMLLAIGGITFTMLASIGELGGF